MFEGYYVKLFFKLDNKMWHLYCVGYVSDPSFLLPFTHYDITFYETDSGKTVTVAHRNGPVTSTTYQ